MELTYELLKHCKLCDCQINEMMIAVIIDELAITAYDKVMVSIHLCKVLFTIMMVVCDIIE